MTPDATQYDEVRQAIDNVITDHRDVLNNEPRLLRPLLEARDSAKTKYEDAKEPRCR